MKTYTIRCCHAARAGDPITACDFTGTIDELCTKVSSYLIECGHGWNLKSPLYPKTGRALVKALNASACECRRYSDWYILIK